MSAIFGGKPAAPQVIYQSPPQVEPEEDGEKKKKRYRKTQTILTSPQGDLSEAPVNKKTLLGQ